MTKVKQMINSFQSPTIIGFEQTANNIILREERDGHSANHLPQHQPPRIRPQEPLGEKGNSASTTQKKEEKRLEFWK